MANADVLIIGGGILGSIAALFLARRDDFRGSIIVVEPDPTYRDASTTRSAASLRQQFALPVNIAMSRFGAAFLRDHWPGLAREARPRQFHEAGYLMLARPDEADRYRAMLPAQLEGGAAVAHLLPFEIAARFPWLATDDLALGSLGLSGEGWFDAGLLLRDIRAAAERAGVDYREARVTGLGRAGGRIVDVGLSTGERIGVDVVVNAAGRYARAVAALGGIELPVESRKRCIFTFTTAVPLERCPFVFDPTAGAGGYYFRPDADRFIAATAPAPADDDERFDFEVDWRLFHEVIAPALARRVPALAGNIEVGEAWAGHYDTNVYDMNALIGPAPEVANFHQLTGFSGHGVMHAPAAGRGIAELIATGRYQTIDLSAFLPTRIEQGLRLDDLQCCETREGA